MRLTPLWLVAQAAMTGANSNTTALVGTPEQVAEAFGDYYDLGISHFLIRGFDPLIDEPWVPARVEDAIAGIVSDADAAFDPELLWPAQEWDGWEETMQLKSL